MCPSLDVGEVAGSRMLTDLTEHCFSRRFCVGRTGSRNVQPVAGRSAVQRIWFLPFLLVHLWLANFGLSFFSRAKGIDLLGISFYFYFCGSACQVPHVHASLPKRLPAVGVTCSTLATFVASLRHRGNRSSGDIWIMCRGEGEGRGYGNVAKQLCKKR